VSENSLLTPSPNPIPKVYPLFTSLSPKSGKLRENQGSKYLAYGNNIVLNINQKFT
jgi:hypothetical protein